MFPTLKVNLSGLDPNTKYFVLLDLVLADDSRFRFNAGWLRSGKAEPQWPSRIYTHPDSPATGAQWMKHEISFQKVKLTNNTMDQQGHVRCWLDCLSITNQSANEIDLFSTVGSHFDAQVRSTDPRHCRIWLRQSSLGNANYNQHCRIQRLQFYRRHGLCCKLKTRLVCWHWNSQLKC